MFLLITGASGVGKSTVREKVAAELSPQVECVELAELVPLPAMVTKAWRQQAVEAAVRRAVELQGSGRHLLLAGDPVPAIEIVAGGDRIAAGASAGEAQSLAAGMGAAPLLAEIDALIRRARLHPGGTIGEGDASSADQPVSEAAAADPFGLTPREREVLRLVPTAAPTARSRSSCSSPGPPPACTSRTSCPSSASPPGCRRLRWPTVAGWSPRRPTAPMSADAVTITKPR